MQCHVLVLQDTDWVRIANRRLQQPLGIFRTPRRHDLKSRDTSVPSGVILRMLRSDARREPIGSSEGDVTRLNAARHVVSLCGRVDDLIDGLHGEIEGHELALGASSRVSICI